MAVCIARVDVASDQAAASRGLGLVDPHRFGAHAGLMDPELVVQREQTRLFTVAPQLKTASLLRPHGHECARSQREQTPEAVRRNRR